MNEQLRAALEVEVAVDVLLDRIDYVNGADAHEVVARVKSAIEAALAAAPSTPEPGIDVERLAEAIRAWWTGDSVTGDAGLDAEEIAAKYALLASEDRTPPAEKEQT